MGRNQNDATDARRFRRKLLKWGMHPNEAELCVKEWWERREAKRRGELEQDAAVCTRAEYARLVRKNKPPRDNSAAILHLGDDFEGLSNVGYAPTKVDSVLTGPGRAVGSAARSVKRRKALTKYEYDKQNEEG